MTILTFKNISKSFNDKELFNYIAYGIESGEKIGLIGRNGAGKTTLMKLIAGLDEPDNGEVVFNKNVRFEFLDQLPDFSDSHTIIDYVMMAKLDIFNFMDEYNSLCNLSSANLSTEQNARLAELSRILDENHAWSLENDAKSILHQLGMDNYNDIVTNLSGGEKKRVALAKALLSDPDLLILDEPTNHLDADSVQWLQDFLSESSKTLLFVTHDRYFLDAVANKIVEIDEKKLFVYPGSYEKYLESKESYLSVKESTFDHQLSKLRTELMWLQKGAKARRTKQKSRIDWITEMKKKAVKVEEKKIKIELGKIPLNNKIIEANYIGKSIGERLLFDMFTYNAKPGDRIGIIGPNGSGKSTLLRTLCGMIRPDLGKIEIGLNTKIGYFEQEITSLKDSNTVIGSLREIAEYVDVGVGRDRYLTVRDLLDKFAFPRYQHGNYVITLSGGEKRRLALVRVLMANPNVLFLDEPTNDFDIQTLTALEEYLDDFYGVLIIVSHDRAFLDRVVNVIYAFDGKGNIKEYPGNYSDYLEKKESENRKEKLDNPKPVIKQVVDKSNKPKTKLTFKEQKEYDDLTDTIQSYENETQDITNKLSSGDIVDYKLLEEYSNRLKFLENEIEKATERWLELEYSIEN